VAQLEKQIQSQSNALVKLKNDLNIKMKPLFDVLEKEELTLYNEKKENEKEQKKLDELKKKFRELEKAKKKAQAAAASTSPAPVTTGAGRGRGAPVKK